MCQRVLATPDIEAGMARSEPSSKDRNKPQQAMQKAAHPPKGHPRPGMKGKAPHRSPKAPRAARSDYPDMDPRK